MFGFNKSIDYYINNGEKALKKENYSEAQQYFYNAIKANLNCFYAYYCLYRINMIENNLNNALINIEKVINILNLKYADVFKEIENKTYNNYIDKDFLNSVFKISTDEKTFKLYISKLNEKANIKELTDYNCFIIKYFELLCNRLEILKRLHKYETVLEDLDILLELKPDNNELNKLKNQIISFKKENEEAEEIYSQKISELPNIAKFYCIRAKHRVFLNKYVEAEQDIKKALDLEMRSEDKAKAELVLDSLADYYISKKNKDKALELINIAISLDLENPHYYIMRCGIYYNIGKYKEAKEDINKAKSLKLTGTDKKDCDMYLKKLLEIMQQKKEEIEKPEEYNIETEEEFEERIAKTPDNARLYCARAQYRISLKKYVEAEEDIKKALELETQIEDKKIAASVLDFLTDYYNSEKNTDKALELINIAINLNLKNPHYYIMRCGIYYNIGKYKEAKEDINKAKSLKLTGTDKKDCDVYLDKLKGYN